MVHSEGPSSLDVRNMPGFHQICGMKPKRMIQFRYVLNMLTPSKRKTVELLQLLCSFERALASLLMNNISTLLSVLQVVKAIQTSPSEDIAVIMFTFWLNVLSGAELFKPRRLHRLRLKSDTGIQDSSTLITRYPV